MAYQHFKEKNTREMRTLCTLLSFKREITYLNIRDT